MHKETLELLRHSQTATGMHMCSAHGHVLHSSVASWKQCGTVFLLYSVRAKKV